MSKDRKMLERLEKALEIMEDWFEADVIIKGPGPRGGYQRRLDEIQRLRRELEDHLSPVGIIPLDETGGQRIF